LANKNSLSPFQLKINKVKTTNLLANLPKTDKIKVKINREKHIYISNFKGS